MTTPPPRRPPGAPATWQSAWLIGVGAAVWLLSLAHQGAAVVVTALVCLGIGGMFTIPIAAYLADQHAEDRVERVRAAYDDMYARAATAGAEQARMAGYLARVRNELADSEAERRRLRAELLAATAPAAAD